MYSRMEGSSRPIDSVSVVLATYNGEQYLSEQLASLASQVVLPAELVVGDDGSADRTVDIVQDFASSSAFPVRLVRQEERLGYAANFLATAGKAVGSVVAFCDQDDIWHPEKLARVVEAFANSSKVVLVAHQAQLVTADGIPIRRRRMFPTLPARRYPLGTLPLPWYRGFSLSARRELLNYATPDVSNHLGATLAHDGWLWVIASCVGDSVILPDVLVSYRQHYANVIGVPRTKSSQSLRKALDADVATYAYESYSQGCVADYLDHLAALWDREGHNDRAAAARSRSALFHQRAELAGVRDAIYASSDRRSAVTNFADLVRSRSYERRSSAVKDALRILLGPTFWKWLCDARHLVAWPRTDRIHRSFQWSRRLMP